MIKYPQFYPSSAASNRSPPNRSSGLDSLRLVTLLVMLEEGFRIVLDEADMNPFDLLTVAHVVGLVEKYIGGENDAEKDT